MWEEGEVVLTGSWLYDGTVETEVAIQKMPVIYGVRDDELPPEMSADQYIENYYIWYETPGKLGVFRAGGGCAFTLEEAKAKVEDMLGQKVMWKEAKGSMEEN